MSGKNNKEQKPLPKWYDGMEYTESEVVENRFTGDKALLSPNEVAMYDLIMGAEQFQQWELMEKGLSWFRSANPKAYMTLLD